MPGSQLKCLICDTLLKFLPPHLSRDEASRARFTREAKAAAKLDHPNIVLVHEVGEFNGRPFFAMISCHHQAIIERLTISHLFVYLLIILLSAGRGISGILSMVEKELKVAAYSVVATGCLRTYID